LTKGKERTDLESDQKLELALTRLLEVIGEATSNLNIRSNNKKHFSLLDFAVNPDEDFIPQEEINKEIHKTRKNYSKKSKNR
jgi:hypothetical protein